MTMHANVTLVVWSPQLRGSSIIEEAEHWDADWEQVNVSFSCENMLLNQTCFNTNWFQEKSTKDAAAVKILTVITLVYLPTTIVAVNNPFNFHLTSQLTSQNFFSTQFVQTQDDGHMRVATNVWLLAAIAIPLTLLTIGLWWTWVHFTEVKPAPDPLQPGVVTLQRQHSFRSIVSSKKKHKQHDLEKGLAYAQSPTFPPPFRHSPTTTWSSQATTVKLG